MNSSEKKMVDALIDLKENHHIIGVKAEFEAEGTNMQEAIKLKEIVTQAGLELTIKIGGCEALKDLYDVKTLGAKAIVAPMIESTYALKKFIKAVNSVFSEEELDKINLFINIETITGFKCFEEIMNIEQAKTLKGIIFGRVDMSGSLDLEREEVNSQKMLDFALKLAESSKKNNKEFIVGGGVSSLSIPFFKSLSNIHLSGFETRKIIFDAQKSIQDQSIFSGINKAIDFEIMWLQNKKEINGYNNNTDEKRLLLLEKMITCRN